MYRMRGVVSLLGAVAMTAACQPAAETAEQAEARMASEAAAARTAIEASNARFVTHFNAGQGDSVAAHYTEDGRVMAPNMPVASGRQAIAASMGMMGGATLALTTESVAANGSLAVERGTYKITLTPPGATAPITDTGKYLVHWHKVGDNWMMVDDIWNSDLPAMPMGPPAKQP
jgi:ketosteroid isomerase-like protein